MLARRTVIYLILALVSGVVGFADDLLPSSYLNDLLLPISMLFEGTVKGLARMLAVVSLLLFTISLLFGRHLSGRW